MATQTTIDQWKYQTTFHSNHVIHHTVGTRGEEISTRWTEVREIGSGGFGSVDLEKGIVDGVESVRAVKRISRNFYSSRKGLSRELGTLIAVQDYKEQFVQFFGWYEDKHSFYIAMEYLELGDLGQYLKNHGSIAKTHAIDITKQLLEALTILHKNNICHRDLKPPNVLIASLSPIRVKLADFGTSKFTAGTTLKTRCGTSGYIPPEIQGLFTPGGNPYTYAVDMWSLGCLVHNILTSEVPFQENLPDNPDKTQDQEAKNNMPAVIDMELLDKFCSGYNRLPIASLKKSGASTESIDFIQKLLVLKPDQRMSAVDALKHSWLREQQHDNPSEHDQHIAQQYDNPRVQMIGGRYISRRQLERFLESRFPQNSYWYKGTFNTWIVSAPVELTEAEIESIMSL